MRIDGMSCSVLKAKELDFTRFTNSGIAKPEAFPFARRATLFGVMVPVEDVKCALRSVRGGTSEPASREVVSVMSLSLTSDPPELVLGLDISVKSINPHWLSLDDRLWTFPSLISL